MSSSIAGDYGFDPLGFGTKDLFSFGAEDKQRSKAAVMADYRDAELRHGRLAMFAALAWPVQELVSPAIARFFNREVGLSGLSDILNETGGRSPSVLNGGLEQGVVPLFMLALALVIGAIDASSLKLRAEKGEDFVPGDFGFDPLNILAGASPAAVLDMQAKEVNNGRLAMVAVTAYVVQEFVGHAPVVALSWPLFTPLFNWPVVREQLDVAFNAASEAQRIPAAPVEEFFKNIPK
jgi:hypothetical protein